jgi:hypothetical protein
MYTTQCEAVRQPHMRVFTSLFLIPFFMNFMKNRMQNFIAAVLLTAYGMFLSSPIAFAAAPVVTSFFPSHSVTEAGVGTTVNMFFTAQDNASDLSIGGVCLVNGVEVGSTLINFNNGSYELHYTVGASDPSRAAGTVPLSCVIENPAHEQTTVSAFDANQLSIVTPVADPSGSGSGGSTATTPPAAPTVTIPAYASSTNQTAFPLEISGLEGASLQYIVSDGASHTVSGSGTVADGKYDVSLDISSLIDGMITASATQMNGTTSPAGTATAMKDTVAPAFGTLSQISQTATGTTTSVSLSTPSVTDADSNPTITNNAPSAFPLGTTTVTWMARDHAGNSSTSNQMVVVTQAATSTGTTTGTGGGGTGTTATSTALSAPVITAPAYASSTSDKAFHITASGQDGATLNYVVSDGASHSITGSDVVSGGLIFGTFNLENFSFADGPITITATQTLNSTTSPAGIATSTKDTVPPVFGTISPITQSTTGTTTAVSLSAPSVTDAVDSHPIVTSNAPSSFPLGDTTVIWTARDHAGNTATTTQKVTVTQSSQSSGGGSGGSSNGGGGSSGGGGVFIPGNGPIVGILASHGRVQAPFIIIATSTATTSPQVPGSIIRRINLSIARVLKFGMRGADIRELQALLSQDPSIYPQALVTGYFGPLTRQAVTRFQLKNGIVASTKEAGTGVVGPKTISKLNEISGEQNLSSQHSE